jgi:hypothetical protein
VDGAFGADGGFVAQRIDFDAEGFEAGALVWHDPRTEPEAWADVRAQRDRLLTASDWTVTRAVETAASIPTAWSDYRQDLRDITEQADPFNITWPTPPA